MRFSFSQISSRRSSWIWFARGLKRNLEHLEVRGSIILENTQIHSRVRISHKVCLCVLKDYDWWVSWPADVVTDETEAGGAGLLLHGPPECRLSWCRHGVRFIQDDYLKRGTRLPTTNTGKQWVRVLALVWNSMTERYVHTRMHGCYRALGQLLSETLRYIWTYLWANQFWLTQCESQLRWAEQSSWPSLWWPGCLVHQRHWAPEPSVCKALDWRRTVEDDRIHTRAAKNRWMIK